VPVASSGKRVSRARRFGTREGWARKRNRRDGSLTVAAQRLLGRPASLAGLRLLGAEDLDPDAVRVEGEEGIVVLQVAGLLGREVDLGAQPLGALEGRVDLVARVDLERDVLDTDVVVAVLAAIGRSQPEVLLAELEVDDFFGAAVSLLADVFFQPERCQELRVESQRALDVADAEIDVLDAAPGDSKG
jgi:hypothetical protein